MENVTFEQFRGCDGGVAMATGQGLKVCISLGNIDFGVRGKPWNNCNGGGAMATGQGLECL